MELLITIVISNAESCCFTVTIQMSKWPRWEVFDATCGRRSVLSYNNYNTI
jgi:hypothetical protein